MNEDFEDKVDAMLRKHCKTDVPPALEQRLRRELSRFHARLDARDLLRGQWMMPPLRVFVRTAAAIAAVVAIIGIVTLVFGSATAPTWADVAERFGSVPFFTATAYIRQDAVSNPLQLEFWMGQGGMLRMRVGNEMIFGENGRIVESVRFAPPTESQDDLREARALAQEFIGNLGGAKSFSFDTLLKALPYDGMLSLPLENENASLSRDLVVFDVTNEDDPTWIRIWALRESRLPVRMLFWDPRSSASVDVVLSYAEQQPPEFFDPMAFKRELAEPPLTGTNEAYALLDDPGGRPITPQDAAAFEKTLEERRAAAVDSSQ